MTVQLTSRSTRALAVPLAAALATFLAARPSRAAGELAARDFVARAGRVVTMSGEEHAPGVLVIKDGRIAAVGGEGLEAPKGLPVEDFGPRVLVPGFIDAHSQRGLDRAFEIAPDASFVRVTDALNPVALDFEDARRNGITTLLVAPDDRTLLGGRAAIVHPQGIAVDTMVVKQDAALKISLHPPRGTSRMGHLARLRELLDGTKRFLDERAAAKERARRDGTKPPDDEIPPSRQALVDLLEGRLPAWVSCPGAADVAAALGLAREHGIHVTLVLAPEAWRAAPLLRENRLTVVLTPRLETVERLADGSYLHVNLPRTLHDAGVPFALTTDPADATAQHPWFQAARAVRGGVPRAAALAAVTQVPAKLLGFGPRKGVLAAGADADFLVLSADPLAADCWVDEAYVRGTRIYDRRVDDKLARLVKAPPEPPVGAPEIDHEEGEDEGADAASRAAAPATIAEDPERSQRWPAPPPPPASRPTPPGGDQRP